MLSARDTEQMESRVQELEIFLRDEIRQLEEWGRESVKGGWSTHQVDAMRKRADLIRRLLLP